MQIFDQLNRTLTEKVSEGNVINHNLEKGLGAERALRSLLRDFLPSRFGVAKGKIVNYGGDQSQACDIIIYDRLNCARLFVDQNENQIIPIEGIYAVIEVKVTLTKGKLNEAFDNLASVHNLSPARPVRSKNKLVDFCPPALIVVGFNGPSLATIERHYLTMNHAHPVGASFSSYSEVSPGFDERTGKSFLVNKIACLGSGTIFHTYAGEVKTGAWGQYTLGMLLMSLLTDIEQIPYSEMVPVRYFNFMMIEDAEYFSRNLEWQ